MTPRLQAALVVHNAAEVTNIAKVLGVILYAPPRHMVIRTVCGTTAELTSALAQVVQEANKSAGDTDPTVKEAVLDDAPLSASLVVKEVLRDETTNTLLLAVGAEDQTELLRWMYDRTTILKHVFSMNTPCDNTRIFSELMRSYNSYRARVTVSDEWESAPLWLLYEPGRYETFLNKVIRLLPECGEPLSVTISLSEVPVELDADINTPETQRARSVIESLLAAAPRTKSLSLHQEIVFKVMRTYMALSGMIRKMFATEIVSLVASSSLAKPAPPAATSIVLANGATVTILLTPKGPFTMSVYGTHNALHIRWKANKGFYECRRDSDTAEHPSYMPSTGTEWTLIAFKDLTSTCFKCDDKVPAVTHTQTSVLTATQRNSPNEIWIDMAVAQAALASEGTPVCFQAA